MKVPHFHKKYVTIDEIPQVLLMRGRRKGSQILTQLKEDMSQMDQLPQPKRKLQEASYLKYVLHGESLPIKLRGNR